MLFQLNDTDNLFPDPAFAEPDGLLAIGGDLSTERLLNAYRSGIFPWYSDDEPILWYSPHERCVIFPGEVVISKTMEKIIKKGLFQIKTNTAFKKVIECCKGIERKDQDGTWITNEMEEAYIKLHEQGFAHSIEVWQHNELVGGLYGVVVNDIFCGESMFSKVSNASKAALIWLCSGNKYRLTDCQLRTDHLISMGAKMIPQKEYLSILNKNL